MNSCHSMSHPQALRINRPICAVDSIHAVYANCWPSLLSAKCIIPISRPQVNCSHHEFVHGVSHGRYALIFILVSHKRKHTTSNITCRHHTFTFPLRRDLPGKRDDQRLLGMQVAVLRCAAFLPSWRPSTALSPGGRIRFLVVQYLGLDCTRHAARMLELLSV